MSDIFKIEKITNVRHVTNCSLFLSGTVNNDFVLLCALKRLGDGLKDHPLRSWQKK